MWSIVFFTDHRGTCPPLDFINKLPVMDQAKIRNSLRLLQEFGPNLSMPHVKQIKGKLGDYVQEEFDCSILLTLINNLLFCMVIENKVRKLQNVK